MVGSGGGGEEKEKKFAKNKVCANEPWDRRWRARRGLGESQQEPRSPMLLPGAQADTHTHTHTHSPIRLCSRLEFLSLARSLSLAALHASPLSKQRAAAALWFAGPAGGGHPERGRWLGSGHVLVPTAQERAAWSLLRAWPRR